MAEKIAYDGEDFEESVNPGPLPEDTRVLATVLPTNKNGQSIVRRPYANQGSNANLTALGVRFRIADGQVGAGRNVFANIALSRKFASGSKNHAFGGFFGALDYDVNDKEGFEVPEDHELLGEPLTLVLGIEEDGKGGYRNNVKFFNKPSAGTPKGTKLPEVKLPGQQRQAPANVQAQQQWTPSGPPVAQPPVAGAPAWMPDQAAVAASVVQPTAAPQQWTPNAAALAGKGF